MRAIDDSSLELLGTPYGFARGILNLPLYPWQENVMAAMNARGACVAVKASNGSGKSARLGAPLAIWNAVAFPGSLTIVTAGVYRQVKEQFFAAVRSFAHLFPKWEFLETAVKTDTGSRIYGFSTDDPGRFEGFHDDNLLVICDEAKSIPDSIFEAIERCQPTRLLLISSPGAPNGTFYRAFTRDKRFYRTFSVTAMDCPHIEPKWIAQQIEKHGEQSPLVRSMIFGEFQEDGEDGCLISLRSADGCLANPPLFEEGDVQAFCDFAAGGDENVLAVRRGNRVSLVAAWRDRNTMSTVGRFVKLFEEQKLAEGEIYGDGSGLGKPICDRLREVGWRIRSVNNGDRASEPKYYANLGAEIWAKGARQIERRDVILPDDEALISQLTTRGAFLTSKGQIQLESKDQLKRRGCPSPDRADAILGALFKRRKAQFLI